MSKDKDIFIKKMFNMIPDLNIKDKNSSNILHHLVELGDENLVNNFLEKALMTGNIDNIVNIKNKYHMTPLHVAVNTKQQKIAQTLINYGADPNISDINGNIIKWQNKNMSGGGKNKKIKIIGFRKI